MKTRLAWELAARADRRRQSQTRAADAASGDASRPLGSERFKTFDAAFEAFEAELHLEPSSQLARQVFQRFCKEKGAPVLTPAQFCHIDHATGLPLLAWVQAGNGVSDRAGYCTHVFFEWLIDGLPSAVDDFGQWVRSPDHINPLPLSAIGIDPRPALRALPTRYLHAAMALLVENNFGWASHRAEDQATVTDAGTGKRRREWNPVCAAAVLLKMLLPLTTDDVRLLQSRKADAPPQGETSAERLYRPRGFVQLMPGADGQLIAGCRIVGGTLAPRHRRRPDPRPLAGLGYDLPLERPGVLSLVELLESFQGRFNASAGPLPWLHVAYSPYAHLPRPVQRRLADGVFLLCDVQSPQGSNQPVTHDRLNAFWLALLARLEEVLHLRGERGPDGESVTLIRRWDPNTGAPLQAVYGLETLRVSTLAWLRAAGLVPAPLLAQLSGHQLRPRRHAYATCGLPPLRGNPHGEALARFERSRHRRQLLAGAERQQCASDATPPTLLPPPRRPRFR